LTGIGVSVAGTLVKCCGVALLFGPNTKSAATPAAAATAMPSQIARRANRGEAHLRAPLIVAVPDIRGV
jgi:hypothetical protein